MFEMPGRPARHPDIAVEGAVERIVLVDDQFGRAQALNLALRRLEVGRLGQPKTPG